MLKRTIAATGLLLATSSAWAIGPGFHLTGYYENGSADSGGESADVDGFGTRGVFKTGMNWLVAGEYNSLDIDNVDFTDWRVGAGYEFDVTPLASVYGQLDYVSQESKYGGYSYDDKGVGVYFGGEVGLLKLVSAYGRLGYLALDDSNGTELIVGASFAAMPLLRLFAEYHRQDYDVDGAPDTEADSVRVGVRFAFNN